MVDPVTAAISVIGSSIGGTAGAFLIMNATAVATATLVAGRLAVGDYQRRKAKRAAVEAYNASLRDRLVMTATADGARSRCYGRVRNTDGVLFKATRGDNSEVYTLVVALAGHEIDAVEQVWFNDTPVTLDASGWVVSDPWRKLDKVPRQQAVAIDGAGNGSVTVPGVLVAGSAAAVDSPGGDNGDQVLPVTVSGNTITVSGATPGSTSVAVTWQESVGTPKARVRAYLGGPGQDLSAELAADFPDLITPGVHRFAGIACLRVDLEYDPDVFVTGLPAVSAVIRGARVLDPRTGVTAWTQNPALIARDWALYANGGACTTVDLVEPSFTAAANACDVAQPFVTATGTVTLPLYTCGIVCRLDEDPWTTMLEIVEAMGGRAGWAGGRLRVVAGVYRAPVATVTDDWLGGQGQIQIVPEPPAADAVNVYRPTIADAGQGYVVVPAPEIRAASYIAADGAEWPREIALGGVTDTVHAQHVCGVLMREAREALTVTLPCNLRAFQVELFDVLAVTLPRFGWEAKTCEVIDWQFGLTGGVVLTLKETAAAIYQPDSSFAVLDLAPNTQLPAPGVVPTLGALTITSGTVALSDGTLVTRTRVQWPAVADESVRSTGRVEVQYRSMAAALPSGDWPRREEGGAATESVIAGLQLGVAYLFRARAVNALGVRGQWSTQTVHVVAGQRATQIYRQATAPTGPLTDGDEWYDTDDGNHHYVRAGGTWLSVRDTGIAAALAAAADAQATADGKIATYWQPTTPTGADEGDIWYDTDDSRRQYRYTGGMWQAADDVRIGAAISAAADAQATADGKVTTYIQASPPVAEAVGDLWLESDNGNRLHRWSGGAWVALEMGTQAIEQGAATDVLTNTAAGPYEDSAVGVAPITFSVPAGGAKVIVTLDGSVGAVNTSGVTRDYFGGLHINVDGVFRDSRNVRQVVPTTQQFVQSVTLSWVSTTLDEGSHTASARIRTFEVGGVTAPVWTDIRLRVEVIKR